MDSVIRTKNIGKSYRITRTGSGLWIEVLEAPAEPLSLDRWDLAELGLVFEEEVAVEPVRRPNSDPRLIEILSELGGESTSRSASPDANEEREDPDTPEWLVNDKSLVDN